MTAQAAGIYVVRLWEAGQACRDAANGYREWALSLAEKPVNGDTIGHD